LVLTGEKPFGEVVVNGHILGPDGYRMSKSRGNVVDPEDKIDEYGADAIRQALLSLTLGSDFSFNWDVVKYCKGFLQKYWSALRFAYRFLKEGLPPAGEKVKLTIMDRWILSKLGEALQTVTENMEAFQFHTAIHVIQNFVWHDFCDQYLEAVKYRLYNKEANTYDGAKSTLHTVLWNITRVLAPICPHIAEEAYQAMWVNQQELTIHACKWPEAEGIPVNNEAMEKGDIVVEALTMIRTQKAKVGIPLNREIETMTVAAPPQKLIVLRENEEEVTKILHIKGVTYEAGDTLHVEIQA
jgi:valyl-tRNA synthetase